MIFYKKSHYSNESIWNLYLYEKYHVNTVESIIALRGIITMRRRAYFSPSSGRGIYGRQLVFQFSRFPGKFEEALSPGWYVTRRRILQVNGSRRHKRKLGIPAALLWDLTRLRERLRTLYVVNFDFGKSNVIVLVLICPMNKFIADWFENFKFKDSWNWNVSSFVFVFYTVELFIK